MFLIIDLNSNNIKSLKNFQFFFLRTKINKRLKIFYNLHSQVSKTKSFTVLKSPHVNKIAQEQFNYRSYKTKLIIFSPNFLLLLYFLKLVNYKLFPNVSIKIKIYSDFAGYTKKFNHCFNPNKYIIKNNKQTLITNYLHIFELFGHFSFLNKNFT